MKGKTIIELTDARGKKEVYEDSNIITKGAEYLLVNTGGYDCGMVAKLFSNLDSDKTKAISTLYGGLLLFDSQLTENAETLLPTGGTRMIGNAAYEQVSNSEVTEFGSYNSSESGFMPDGSFKFVYDFTTSQANGTINSVCLAPVETGIKGFGNRTSNAFINNSDWKYSSYASDKYISLSSNENIYDIDMTQSTITTFDYYNVHYDSARANDFFTKTGKFRLKTYLIPLTKYDIRNKGILLGEREISIPQSVINAAISAGLEASENKMYYNQTNNCYFIYKKPNVSNGFLIIKLDTNDEVTMFDINLSTQLSSNALYEAFVIDDKMIITTSSGWGTSFKYSGLFVCDLNNPVDTVQPDGAEKFFPTTSNPLQMIAWNTDLIVYGSSILDLHDMKMVRTNGTFSSNLPTKILNISNNKILKAQTTLYSYIYRYPCFLSTINNLSQPVVKTSDKTMKVTYILNFDN